MCKKEKISIIIPVYNVEKYLDECLRSIQNQTYQNFEALIVDDGSTDESASIARSYACADNRFVLYCKTNGGQGSARNYGLDRATGEYVAFCDGDDFLHPDYLEKLMDSLVQYDADISMCNVLRVWDDGTKIVNKVGNHPKRLIEDTSRYLAQAHFSLWDKLYKIRLFDGIRFPDKIKYEDFATTPRVLARAKKIICIEDILYFYRWRAGSTTNDNSAYHDILAAQQILERSELMQTNPEVLQVYFVRMVLESLTKKLVLSRDNWGKIDTYMACGKNMYPEMMDSIRALHGFDKQFGLLIFEKKYGMARFLIAMSEGIKGIIRPVYHFFNRG